MAKPQGDAKTFTGFFKDENKQTNQTIPITATVPEYQREYDWSKGHVEQLLESFRDHISEVEKSRNIPDNPYFVGNIMIHKPSTEQGQVNIVDGQQRIVTLTLIAAAVRDLLFENDQYQQADELHETTISAGWDINKRRLRLTTGGMKERYDDDLIQPFQVPAASPNKSDFSFKIPV